MTECPKCNAQLEDGTKFCSNCGAQIFETVFCSNCGKQTSTEFAFCQSCGASMAEESKAEEKKTAEQEIPATGGASSKGVKNPMPKKPPFKLAALALTAIVVIGVGAFALKGLGGSSKVDYALYVKDNELYINDFSKKGALEISTNLFKSFLEEETDDPSSMETITYALGGIPYDISFNQDTKTIFYVDKMEDPYNGQSIYYKSVDNPKEEATLIDKDIMHYVVNENATRVIYVKKDDLSFYEYDLRKDEKIKIDEYIHNFMVSKNGDTIFYTKVDGVYIKVDGKDSEKISKGEEPWILKVSDDFQRIYYITNADLYRYELGKEPEKIASDVYDVIQFYDGGEIYYVKQKDKEIPSVEFMLCYYDGSQENVISETMAFPIDKHGEWNPYELGDYDRATDNAYRRINSFYAVASDTPVIVFRSYSESGIKKLRLNEMDYFLDEYILESLFESSEMHVAIKGTSQFIDENNGGSFAISNDGNEIYFSDTENGDLYRITVGEGKISEAEVYDREVSGYGLFGFMGNMFVYSKDSENGYRGEVYVNKGKLDEDVAFEYTGAGDSGGMYGYTEYAQFNTLDYENSIVGLYEFKYDPEKKRFIYFTNLGVGGGTLKIHQDGKAESISEDVVQFKVLSDGDIMYLKDYEDTDKFGDLYLYKNGKSEKIDEEVNMIIGTDGISHRR